MISMVIVALIVLFGAALIGKMLMDMFPGPITSAFKDADAEEQTPAE